MYGPPQLDIYFSARERRSNLCVDLPYSKRSSAFVPSPSTNAERSRAYRLMICTLNTSSAPLLYINLEESIRHSLKISLLKFQDLSECTLCLGVWNFYVTLFLPGTFRCIPRWHTTIACSMIIVSARLFFCNYHLA